MDGGFRAGTAGGVVFTYSGKYGDVLFLDANDGLGGLFFSSFEESEDWILVIALDPESVPDKALCRCNGGYCF